MSEPTAARNGVRMVNLILPILNRIQKRQTNCNKPAPAWPDYANLRPLPPTSCDRECECRFSRLTIDRECERHLSRLTLLRAVPGPPGTVIAGRPPFYVLRACFGGSPGTGPRRPHERRFSRLTIARLLPPGSAGSATMGNSPDPRCVYPCKTRLPRSRKQRQTQRPGPEDPRRIPSQRQYVLRARSFGPCRSQCSRESGACAHTTKIRHLHEQVTKRQHI